MLPSGMFNYVTINYEFFCCNKKEENLRTIREYHLWEDYSITHLSMVRVSLEKFTPIMNVLDPPQPSLVASESPKNCS